ncbi:MAG: carbohydrate binding family 9 domain-containing protein [Cryomorphaceae bacterium]|nr:carbohydrate binding family 9 domain-containing protein [Cryomorphaceae bacterium]
MRKRQFGFVFGFFLMLGMLFPFRFTYAQISSPNQLQAYFTEEVIKMDGRLNEPAWMLAQRISNFTQRELEEGNAATEKTEVAVVYTDRNLYIGVWCYDSEPDKIIAKEMKRDFNDNLDDNVKIIIDTYNDKRNGFLFIVNPNGARADLQVFDNGSSVNRFWNGVWDVRVTRTEEGWFAEFEIPLSTLKFRNDKEDINRIWGFNVERNIRRKREQVFWQGWSRDANIQQVNRAGKLTGLNRLRNRRFVEFKPYGIGGGSNVADNVFRRQGNMGGDVNYLLSPTYRLNVTVNTDFAEVESDQEQINLTRFPLFFPELREFFLEGQDYFDFGFGGNRIIPFYSRQIGLDEDRNPVPMLGGVRLLGKEGGSTMGLMSIQTGATESEPMTNYTVGSWRQDVLDQSTVGFMTVNKITDEGWHTTTGGNFRYATDKFLGKRNLNIGGAYIHTFNSRGEFQRDAFAYRSYLAYPNDKINVFASMQRSPQNFNPEVGLQRRQNFQEYFAQVLYRPRPKSTGALSWIRQWDFTPGQLTYTIYNDTRFIQSFLYEIRPFGFFTRSGEYFNFMIDRHAEGLIEDFIIYRKDEGAETRQVVIDKGEYWYTRYRFQAGTFGSRTLSGDVRFSFGEFYGGSSTQQVWSARWRTSAYLTVSTSVEWNNVNLPDGSFSNQLLGTRFEYALNPRVFGLIYAQINQDRDLFIFNFRLQWIPIIGADFFFIVNHIVNTSEVQLIEPQTQILGKLIWRFVL